jgi:hypothetical protein
MIRISILNEEEINKLKTLDKIRQAEKERLEQLITAHKSGWLKKAKTKTDKFRSDNEYTEKTGSWSEIKEVYMALQANKCAYCEQKLEAANIVHDVEHFRPKKSVSVWLIDERKKLFRFTFSDAESKGYHLLAYNIFNYVTACKQCNTPLKSNCFPIAGIRIIDSEDFGVINSFEKPFLPYPLGNLDDDAPEDLISFNGVSPIINPKINDEHKKLRARVTIKFFDLEFRETLIKQRCEVIKKVYDNYVEIKKGDENDPDIITKKQYLDYLIDSGSEHANCARSFLSLCENNLEIARKFYDEALIYILANRKI